MVEVDAADFSDIDDEWADEPMEAPRSRRPRRRQPAAEAAPRGLSRERRIALVAEAARAEQHVIAAWPDDKLRSAEATALKMQAAEAAEAPGRQAGRGRSGRR